jgi:hypothetical protein
MQKSNGQGMLLAARKRNESGTLELGSIQEARFSTMPAFPEFQINNRFVVILRLCVENKTDSAMSPLKMSCLLP